MSDEDIRLRQAAAKVISAADDAYGRGWRTWASTGAGVGARRLSAALGDLEYCLANYDPRATP